MTDPDTTQDALAAFELLRQRQRLRVLDYFRSAECPVACAELARRVHDRTENPDRTEVALQQELHHQHLPALNDTDVLTYDRQQRVVTSFDRARFDALCSAMQTVLDSLATE